MKKLLLLFTGLLVFSACAVTDSEFNKDIDVLAQEITDMQVTIADLKTNVDDLEIKNEALSTELTHKEETIVELETEVTYLTNELNVSKNRGSTPTFVGTAVESPKTTKIVIVEDSESIKNSLYSHAFELYNQGRHEESIEKFREFIIKLPNDDLAVNSQYWIGENYYSMKNFNKAIEEFKKVLSKYPNGRKAPDATLKIGYSYKMLGQNAKAKEALNEVIKKYPKSNAATLAQQKLAAWKL